VVVYVALPDEAVPVWRPALAEHLGANRYRLVAGQRYDSEHERWEFVPGDEVICEYITVADGTILAARRKA
jgi:hypothetical protein